MRIWLAGAASVALLVGSATAGFGAPEAAPTGSVRPIQSAVKATFLAQTLHYSVAVTVGGTAMTATGAVDLTDNRTGVNVSVGRAASEFRRVGNSYYVNARRLGAGGATWVALNAAGSAAQLAVRSVVGLVSSVSPQQTLQALRNPLTARLLGKDAYGTRYRVVVPQPKASFVPLAGAMTLSPITAGPSEQVEVWIDAQGRVSRFVTTAEGVSSTFTLRDFGAEVDVTAPPSKATSGLNSPSGRYLFADGLVLRRPSGAAPAVTVSPTVSLADGIVLGTLQATSNKGLPLAYEYVSSTKGGKLSLGTVGSDAQSYTILPYATWLETGGAKGLETFTVQVREVTRVDTYVHSIPLIGDVATASIRVLQGTPAVSAQFAPSIGAMATASIDVHVDQLAPGDIPIAFTAKVPGYRGTPISANFFPASGLAAGDVAPLLLNGPGLAQQGSVNPFEAQGSAVGAPGVAVLRNSLQPGDVAYNVVTWDPRGSFASGGRLQLNNPFFEASDVSNLIDWAGANLPVVLNGANDPAMGMVGGSAGGEIQLATAGLDPRVDAIVPSVAWNSVITSLQPNGILDTGAAKSLLAKLTASHVRADEALLSCLRDSIAAGRLSEKALTLLSNSNAGPLLRHLQAPTLLVQDVRNSIFPVSEANANAVGILSNPFGVPTKLLWFDSGEWDTAMAESVLVLNKLWLDKYVAGLPIPDAAIPTFQWWDQVGDNYTSALLPFDAGFNTNTPLSATSTGGRLSFKNFAGARVSLNVAMPLPEGTQIAGAPTIRFTYTGSGTARAVTVKALSGGIQLGRSTGVPVVLDGRSHTVDVPLSDFAYTAPAGAQINFTISTTPQPFGKPGTGSITISAVAVSAPVRA